MAMMYDNIYRIVPSDQIPDDPSELQPLLEDRSIGRTISPESYSSEASDKFLSDLDRWHAAALYASHDESEQFTRLHTGKIDETVRYLFKEMGYKERSEWLHIPTELASNYMLYLAKEIAAKNNLDLITQDWAPWTATSYFLLDGGVDEFVMAYEQDSKYWDAPFALFSFIISNFVPLNISEIPSEKILKFREERKDEIALFRKAIYDLQDELHMIEEPELKRDIIAMKIDDLRRAQEEYQKSADLINVKAWGGFSFMGIPAPIALGKLFSLPYASTAAIAGTALAIGGIYSIAKGKSELLELRQKNPASLLVDIGRDFKHYTRFRADGDANFHAFNCMEEYVND